MKELVYVDEQEGQGYQVLRSAVASGQFTKEQVVSILPEASIEKTIDKILEYECKVLISDYRLSEHNSKVQFNGVELVKEYQIRYYRFPCFVTTAFAEEAIDENIDTNIVFPKSDFLGIELNSISGSDLPFFNRVRKKILEYDTFVSRLNEEWESLIDKKENNKNLNAKETQRLIDLDTKLESLNGRHLAVAKHLKDDDTMKTFNHMIQETKKLIEKIENEIGAAKEKDE